MPTTIRFLFTLVLVLNTFAEDPAYKPKLVNSKSGEHHDFPLGVLEATGRLQEIGRAHV